MILIVGDSLPLPRPFDGVAFEQTYPFLLQQEFLQEPVINFSRGAATSSDCLRDLEDRLHYYHPELLILHFGVVDSTSRALRRWELATLKMLPRVRTLVHHFVQRHHKRISNARDITYVSERKFEQNIKASMTKVATHTKLIFIKICTPGPKMAAQSPQSIENIIAFNKIIDKYRDGIKVDAVESDGLGLLNDGHHLSINGHRDLKNRITTCVNRLLSNGK